MSVPNVMGGLTVDEVNVAQMYCVLVLCKEQTEEDASGEGKHRYVCKVCGYVYEGDELPADYKCPLCGAGPEYFRQEA